jgi:hypothetical protein
VTVNTQCQKPHRGFRFRLAALVAAMLSLAFDVSAETAPGATTELPRRRPGHWRISTISPQLGMQTHEVCIDAGDSIIGALADACSTPTVQSTPDETIVTFSCGRGGAREVTSLLFTGDFASWYRAQSKVTVTPANGAAQQRSGFTIDAKFLGPECPEP